MQPTNPSKKGFFPDAAEVLARSAPLIATVIAPSKRRCDIATATNAWIARQKIMDAEDLVPKATMDDDLHAWNLLQTAEPILRAACSSGTRGTVPLSTLERLQRAAELCHIALTHGDLVRADQVRNTQISEFDQKTHKAARAIWRKATEAARAETHRCISELGEAIPFAFDSED